MRRRRPDKDRIAVSVPRLLSGTEESVVRALEMAASRIEVFYQSSVWRTEGMPAPADLVYEMVDATLTGKRAYEPPV